MDTTYAADMLSFMYADNAVDVLNELGKDQGCQLFKYNG